MMESGALLYGDEVIIQDAGIEAETETETETETEMQSIYPDVLSDPLPDVPDVQQPVTGDAVINPVGDPVVDPSVDSDAEVVVGGETILPDAVPDMSADVFADGPQDAVQMQDADTAPAGDESTDLSEELRQMEESLRESLHAEILQDLKDALALTPEEEAAEQEFRQLQVDVLALQKEALELAKEQAPEREAADAEYRDSILAAFDAVTQKQDALIETVAANTRNQKELYRAQMAGNAMMLVIMVAVLFLAGARIAGAFWGTLNKD